MTFETTDAMLVCARGGNRAGVPEPSGRVVRRALVSRRRTVLVNGVWARRCVRRSGKIPRGRRRDRVARSPLSDGSRCAVLRRDGPKDIFGGIRIAPGLSLINSILPIWGGKIVRIAVIGGGPGGLYFAYLWKRRHPDAEIDLFERDPAGATWRFGVRVPEQAPEFRAPTVPTR